MKVVLTIAGSDSSGGAGIQADLKTFEAFGVFGTSVITVLTAQNTTGVSAISELSVDFIKAQLQAIKDDFEIAAVKVGMLYSKEIIECVGEFLREMKCPIVLDPVSISKVGSPLLKEDATQALQKLFTYATVVTPNIYEAKKLFGYSFGDTDSLQKIINSGVTVLVKNQTLELVNEKKSVDQLIFGHQRRVFSTKRIESTNLHGTGCSYSSAIAANLALGHPLDKAIEISKEFIYNAILNAPHIGHGAGPINHKKGLKYA
jgi:hydroxymethylpyrimidine/phosphomethylpyrimidine kinase